MHSPRLDRVVRGVPSLAIRGVPTRGPLTMGRIAGTAENGGSTAAPASASAAILASAATGIVGHIEKLHGDIDSIFGNSGIAPEMAGMPTLQLRLSSFITLFEEAARRTQQDNFGLWFGNQFMPRDLGL